MLLIPFAALAVSATASAQPTPSFRAFGAYTLDRTARGRHIPRVREGTIRIPPGHDRGLVRVIAALQLPPLAVAQHNGAARTTADRLDLTRRSSRAYLAGLETQQRAAAARLHRLIPEATVSHRYRVILNALALQLPVRKLPLLVRQPFIRKVYPSIRYTLKLNESPAIIGAPALVASTGVRGDGIKIAVVDDGIDTRNPFFEPSGYSYPEGFPKGQRQYTNPKIIVARSFPGPGSGRAGRLPVDRRASFHGTHVAGIAAGDANTNAPAGRDHPPVPGLSGVAPRAWLGNYRVFNTPTPIGNSATSEQIVAAFESAVKDGMDVINFSGGAAELDPDNDVLVPAVRATTLAGVVVVIAAGNDRADFGLGSVGTPGTAPDAITVAAVSNTHIFAQVMSVSSPAVGGGSSQIAFMRSQNATPPSWVTVDQALVDIGTITGTDGRPVDRYLCGPSNDPNRPVSTLPRGSLAGVIALVSRGNCSFYSKAQRARAAGATGIVYINNRPGDPSSIGVTLVVPGGMISDLDGNRLRAAMQSNGGRAQVRVGVDPVQIQTGRSAVPAYFSSGGPTSYEHLLKPDISAPGQQILSSTLPEFAGSPFAVFDGTSMATPHIAGAAALLRQHHPGWTPQQVKSALMVSARPAFADTSRTAEAPVLLEGAGLAYLPAADDPKIFASPSSLSLPDVNLNRGGGVEGAMVGISDAGGGGGDWTATVAPQAATGGVTISVPGVVSLPPGGTVVLPVSVQVSAAADPGEQYGFVVLTRGEEVRRIPYFFLVSRPALEKQRAIALKRVQIGSTAQGASNVGIYRYPTTPFGPPPNFVGPGMAEDGAEKLYVTHLTRPAANLGVAVLVESSGAVVDPWFLGSADENDVLGNTGTPVNANAYMFDYRLNVGAAGQQYPRQGRYYISVDSGRDRLTGRRLDGAYLLLSWVNDVRPPRVSLVTTQVSAGRPMVVLRVLDANSGVDPFSIIIAYRQQLVGAAAYDPFSGLAFVPIPAEARALVAGRVRTTLVGSDYQETKNLDQASTNPLPNTAFRETTLRVVNRPTVTWLAPNRNACVGGAVRLVVAAGSTRRVRSVSFYDNERRIARVRRGTVGLYAATWNARRAARGRHVLEARVLDARGRSAQAVRSVRVCRK